MNVSFSAAPLSFYKIFMPLFSHNRNVKVRFLYVSVFAILIVVSGCTSTPPIPTVVKDSGPTRPVDVSHVRDAIPKEEVRTIAGNKSPYTVLGKTYRVRPDSDNYKVRGVASWYGRKFHGRKTSNGDTYDMYGMTAAHKTLPIPTYVRVTNLNNKKSVIVRVNDRGPFHNDRVIDLSYAAAKKLDFHTIGTAPVEVVAIDAVAYNKNRRTTGGEKVSVSAKNSNSTVVTPTANSGIRTEENILESENNLNNVESSSRYLQAGAFSSKELANKLQSKIAGLINYPVFISKENSGSLEAVKQLFKVRIGPVKESWELMSIRELLELNNLPAPMVVYD